MNAQILLGFQITEKIQGRLAADIMNGKPDRFTGEIYSDEGILVRELVDAIACADSYDTVPVPADYAKPEKAFGLKVVFDVKDQAILLTGSYRTGSGMEASLAVQFAARASDLHSMDGGMSGGAAGDTSSEDPETEYIWWLGAQLKNFTLSDISSALEGVDRFLGLENVTAAVILSNAEQEIHGTEGIPFLGEIGSVPKGLTFQTEVAFGDSLLKEALDIKGSCRISGYIPLDEDQGIQLSGHGDELVFLQFLSLKDMEITLEKKAKEKTFSFSVKGNLKLFFPELPLPEIGAEISFEENQAGEKVMLQGQVSEPVEEPLGIPDTTLEQVRLIAVSESFSQGSVVEKKEQVYFQGDAEIAELRIAARIYFVERVPAVVELSIGKEQRLSVSSLLKKYFDFDWPGILDIQLYHGRILYFSRDVLFDQTMYQAGFYVQADTKIFFLPEFALSVHIDSGPRFVADVRLKEAARLAFIKLYTAQGREEYGPHVVIQVTKEEVFFTVTACVAMFSEELGEVRLTAGKNRLEGTFCFPDRLPIAGKVAFYVDEKGLSLGACSIGKLPDMNFKLPKMEYGDGKCRVKVLDDVKFHTVPEVKSKEFIMDEDGLKAEFDLILRIRSNTSFAKDGGDDVVTLPFEGLSLSADKDVFHDFTFDNFMQILGANIAELAQRMIGEVINGHVFKDILTKEGMENISKFLTIEGITWGTNELVSYLVCRGLKKALADAFVAALTGVVESEWAGAGYVLALGGILGSIGSDGTYTVKKKAPPENKKHPEKNPQTPDAPTVLFQDEKMTIRWKACEGAQGYRSVVSRCISGQHKLDLIVGDSTCTAHEIAGCDEESLYLASYGFEYQVRIYAWNSDGAALGKEASIYLLKRPANMKVRYQCETKRLCLGWDPVERAGQYEVERLWYEPGETKREIVTYESGIKEVIYEDQEPGQAIEVFVRGKAQNVSGPSAGSGRCYLYDLRPPEKIEWYDTDDGIALEWTQVSGADRYRVSWTDGPGGEIKTLLCREKQTVIKIEKPEENVCYTVQIQPMTEIIEGRISENVQALWSPIPVPEIKELVCGEDGLLTFVLVSGGERYRQIVYPDGRALALDGRILSCEWDIGDDAKVRLTDRARQGKWSGTISVQPVRPPEGMQASIKGNTLYVTWDKAEQSCLYGIELMAGGDSPMVAEPLTGTSWQTELSLTQMKESIRVCLYAIDEADTRRRSISAEVSLY